MNNPQELAILGSFVNILEQMNIAYAIGGSLASSIYGKVRFTQDADLTIEPFENRTDRFFEILKPEYYVSKEAMCQALRKRSSFNIIHLESAFKIDVFIRKDTAFEKQLLARRRDLRLYGSVEKTFSVISPEDIVLLKLCWYRDGGCSSQQQRDDVVAVLEVQGGKLDFDYLKKWSISLGINDLLKEAISETG